MCTIIKVKRKITDDPVDCLILECKKRRKALDASASSVIAESAENEEPRNEENRIDSIKQILKYAGSATNENEISERLIELSTNLKSTIENYIKNPKTPIPSKVKEKNLKQAKKEVKSHRYVLLNKKRGVESLDNGMIESITNKELSIDKTEMAINNYGEMNILDVISTDIQEELTDNRKAEPEKISCNGVELISEKVNSSSKKTEYVYDLYYAKNQEIHLDLLYPNNFTINSFDLEFDENVEEEPEDFYEDDEDSNDEGNWRNDYPDEYDDIDDEDDEDGIGRGYMTLNDGEYYNDYDEEGDYKLSAILRKSCNLDRSYYDEDGESDDYEEYDDEESKSYSAYKRKLIRDLNK